MATIRTDGLSGTIENSGGISDTDTTLESADLADLPEVSGGDIARLTFVQLNGIHVSSYEIVHVTAHSVSATTATISRGQEGSSQQAWGEGVDWLHAITVADIEDLVSSVDTVSTNLSSHESDTTNPHSVTSDQVGAASDPHNNTAHSTNFLAQDGSNSPTADVDWDGQNLTNVVVQRGREAITSTSGDVTFDGSANGGQETVIVATGTGSRTFDYTNVPASGPAALFTVYFPDGAPSITWSGTWVFPGGEAPSWSGAAVLPIMLVNGDAVVGSPTEVA